MEVPSELTKSFEILNLYSDASLSDPYPIYDQLRAAGEAVWLPSHQVWAVTGYAAVKSALLNHRTFISGQGIGLTPAANEQIRGSVLASDAPDHTLLRGVLNERLSPRGIAPFTAPVEKEAERLVDAVVARGAFDAVADFAQVFPIAVVGELIGVADTVKPKLLGWADSMFNTFGPPNERTMNAFPPLMEMGAFLQSVTIDDLKPGSLGSSIYEAGVRGTLRPDQCAVLLGAYLGAGLDTTINTISAALYLLAQNPEQWDLLRERPALVPQAYNEVLRMASPVLGFSRVAAQATEIGSQPINEGDRVLLLFAAANRDPRKYHDPARFDILRAPSDHVAFGIGRHHCAGQLLARLEAESLLRALIPRVRRFEAGAPVYHLNNVIRGLASLPITVSA